MARDAIKPAGCRQLSSFYGRALSSPRATPDVDEEAVLFWDKPVQRAEGLLFTRGRW